MKTLKIFSVFRNHCGPNSKNLHIPILLSYFAYQQHYGSDCAFDFNGPFELKKFIRENGCFESSCGGGATFFQQSCYQLTSQAMTFEEAAKECESKGGSLAFYSDELAKTLSKSDSSFWIRGISSDLNPILPYTPPETMTRMRIPIQDVFRNEDENLRGLCALPVTYEDIVKSNEITAQPTCDSTSFCHGKGPCYDLGHSAMCDCEEGFSGEKCEISGISPEH